ncbi:MAG: hypothetical protein JJ975_15780, partial [Bacteroidia bacterium]|nr:hypothetical protein [Bacteroidia bacterium]
IHDFNGNYQVFNGGATISATKMNVLYIGVDNDISVGVPGVNPRDVTVTMTGGSIRRVGSNYTAKCTERGTGKAIITATARMADGSTRQVGSQEYRIKKLPRPKAYFGAIETGSLVPAPAVSLPNRIVANLGRNFVFEGLDYKVVGYTFTITKRKQDPIIKRVNGDHISNDIKRALKNVKPGDRIIIDRIRAQGPSGLEKLDPILVEII